MKRVLLLLIFSSAPLFAGKKELQIICTMKCKTNKFQGKSSTRTLCFPSDDGESFQLDAQKLSLKGFGLDRDESTIFQYAVYVSACNISPEAQTVTYSILKELLETEPVHAGTTDTTDTTKPTSVLDSMQKEIQLTTNNEHIETFNAFNEHAPETVSITLRFLSCIKELS